MEKNKVLFVDDEIGILNSIRRSTMDEDFESLFATSGEEALKIFEQHEISVLVSDMKMPGMDGLTLLKKVREKYPDVIRMVLSGYNQLGQILTTINQVGVSKFITKPWAAEEQFLPAIRESVEYYNLKREGEELKKALLNSNNAYKNILKYNNEIINNIKNDMQNIGKLYDVIQKVNKVIMGRTKDGEVLFTQLTWFNDIAFNVFHGYVDIQPLKVEEITFDKLSKALMENFKDKLSIEKSDDDLNFKGNYQLILLILKEMFKQLIEKEIEEKKLIISICDISSKSFKICVDKSKNSHISYDTGNLSMLVYLLNSVNNIAGGSVSIDSECISMVFSV